ncbi:MAG: PEP-CTERM sorting domain-containing protein [Rubrivivax sp.]|nr:PEP-CTERM sorting domain-containing protein [Rubrivivax sp.]
MMNFSPVPSWSASAAVLCATMLALVIPSLAVASASQSVRLDTVDGQSHEYESAIDAVTGAVSTATGSVSGSQAGTAAAATQTLRVASEVASAGVGGALAYGQTAAAYQKTVLVDPGVSGLAAGDPITLSLTLAFDGLVDAGRFGRVDTRLDYRVSDTGFGGRELGEFWFISTHAYRGNAGDNYLRRYEAWGFADRVSGEVELQYLDQWTYPLNDPTGARQWAVDTGPVGLQIVTVVGATLFIDATLSVLTQANGIDAALPSIAAGDFGSTFDAELTSLVVGINLIGETPGIYGALPVPEPRTWALMLGGMAALAWFARRKRMQMIL